MRLADQGRSIEILFFFTGWLIGILIMANYIPYIPG